MTASLPSAVLAAADAVPRSSGFNWVGLVVLVVLGAVAWPLYRRLRDRISRRRRERWAQEEGWTGHFTPETDPDLRRRPAEAEEPEAPTDRTTP